jgi:hypothetical protein
VVSVEASSHHGSVSGYGKSSTWYIRCISGDGVEVPGSYQGGCDVFVVLTQYGIIRVTSGRNTGNKLTWLKYKTTLSRQAHVSVEVRKIIPCDRLDTVTAN